MSFEMIDKTVGIDIVKIGKREYELIIHNEYSLREGQIGIILPIDPESEIEKRIAEKIAEMTETVFEIEDFGARPGECRGGVFICPLDEEILGKKNDKKEFLRAILIKKEEMEKKLIEAAELLENAIEKLVVVSTVHLKRK